MYRNSNLSSAKAWYLTFILVLAFQFCFETLAPVRTQAAFPPATQGQSQDKDSTAQTPAQLNNALAQASSAATQGKLRAEDVYGKLPLDFELNQGQVDNQVKFFSRGAGYNLFLTANEMLLTLRKPKVNGQAECSNAQNNHTDTDELCNNGSGNGRRGKTDQGLALRMSLVGANPAAQPQGYEPLETKSNYLKGNNPANWKTDVSHYKSILYKQVYPNIDLLYSGQVGGVEYGFLVKPTGNPDAITLKFEGQDRLEISPDGNLILHSKTDQLVHKAPLIYQQGNSGKQQIIPGHYITKGPGQIGFSLDGNYDHTQPLIIDPVLAYSTYLGGSGDDYGRGIAIDGQGNAYITGYTWATDFTTTVGAFQRTNAGESDIFVAKVNPSGTQLLYSTYVGGSLWDDNEDSGTAIAVNSQGQAYVVGSSGSSDFPTTSGVYQPTHQNGQDVVVFKLNATGSGLLYSTFVGGAVGEDYGQSLALDNSGNVYVTGNTTSSDFPTTTGAYRTTKPGGTWDGFVFKLNSTASSLIYSTFFGGSGNDYGQSLGIDSSGNAYVVGYTTSTNFPTTSGAYQTTKPGGTNDAYVLKLNSSGSALSYSTYLGGSSDDYAWGVAVDGSGNAYVTGSTTSTNFPTTSGAYRTTAPTAKNAFVTKINTTGTGLAYSTYLGGSGVDVGQTVTVDSNGNAYVAGYTLSSNFPTTSGAYQTTYGGAGANDVFMTKLNTAGSALEYSTYLGGSEEDYAYGIAVDTSNNVYLSGSAGSGFPTTSGTPQPNNVDGYLDAFVAKLGLSYMVFVTQPVTATAATNFPIQPQVAVKNRDGSTATSYNGPISLTIKAGSGTAGATLSGVTTVNTVSGVASFSGLSIDKPGTSYILTAASNLMETADSQPFTVTARPALLVVAGSGQSTTISTTFATAFKVQAVDGNSNPIVGLQVTFSAPTSGSSASGSFAGGNTTAAVTTDANGYATAPLFTANGVAGSYYVTASATGISSPALFVLNNLGAVLTLELNPPVAGPNALGATQVVSATLKRHGVTPLANETVTFTVSDFNNNNLITTATATTDAFGVATFSYTNTLTRTDTITATANVSGLALTSNTASIYWLSLLNQVSTGPVVGTFFPNYNNSCTFQYNRTSLDQAVFSQTFPNISFFNQNYGSNPATYRPFSDFPTDVNGNPLPDIPARGNGYSAGGDLENFQTVFTGTLVVKQAGVVNFTFYADDGFIFSIGPNSNGVQPTSNDGPSPGLSRFNSYPVMRDYNDPNGSYAYYGKSASVNFPAPGAYPYEVDYVECQSGGLVLTMSANGTPTGLPPAASVALTPTLTSANLTAGVSSQVFTATVLDGNGAVVSNQPVLFAIDGANRQQILTTTNVSGQATITYTGQTAGSDTVQALTWLKGTPSSSSSVAVQWQTNPNGPNLGCTTPYTTTNWLSTPANHSAISGIVPLKAARTLANANVDYWPVSDLTTPPTLDSIQPLASNVAASAGQTLTNFDTTLLANGSYVIRVCESGGETPSASLSLVTVVGENKPGRINFSVTDLTVPVAGMPIVIGRSYDSLERNTSSDFGYGWSLSVGNPKLEVNPAGDVTLNLLDGRRATFFFTPSSSIFGFGAPLYTAEAGVYGTLNSNSCSAVATAGSSGGYLCFPGGRYNPDSYTYRDPYGRLYVFNRASSSSPFKLQSLTDLNGNTLTIEDGGIKSSSKTGALNNGNYVVSFTRDAAHGNRITDITDPNGKVYHYDYATTNSGSSTIGDLIKLTLPQNMPGSANPISVTYSYTNPSYPHLFTSANDPRGNTAVVSTYYPDGRLASVKDALNNTTYYSYDLTTSTVTYTTTITNPDGGITTQVFNTYGKLLSEKDSLNRVITNTYDIKNNLTARKDGLGNITQYDYDANGNQILVQDPLGNKTTTTYNAYSGPLTITDPVTHTYTVGYDENFLPTSVSDSLGSLGGYQFDSRGSVYTRADGNNHLTSFGYDAYGNKTSETDPLNNKIQYAYDTLGHTTYMTDALGYASRYQYDAIGRLITSTVAYTTTKAMTTTYEYDPNGNKSAEVDALGHRTEYVYDAANHLTQVIYAVGTPVSNSVSYAYDWRGNKIQETDPMGRITRYGYDLAGQLISTTYGYNSPEAATIIYEYDAAGHKIKQYNAYAGSGALPNPAPSYIQYEYDAAGRLITLTNQLGKQTIYSYDGAGRRKTEKDALGHLTSYDYDVRGRLTKTTYPTLSDGQIISTTQSYDGAGNVLTRTDGLGKSTTYGYDYANRLRSVTNPMNQATSYNYDVANHLTLITDAENHQTGFEYDELGRQSKKIWPGGTYEQFTYDTVGNKKTQRLADGNTNTFYYDELNRLNQISYFDNKVITYTYWADGKRKEAKADLGITSYSYDGQGRLKQITQPSASNSLTVTYNYYPGGQRASMGTKAGTINYAYDAAYQLTTVTDTQNLATNYEYYDVMGLRKKLTLPNGIKTDYNYDEMNRLKSLVQYVSVPQTPLASYTYSLDGADRRTKVVEVDNSSTEWGYDDVSRLTSETFKSSGGTVLTSTVFTYDKVGNRKTLTVTVGGSSTTTNYSYNQLDQLTSATTGANTTNYTYDGRGNLTQVGASTVYTYNAADRMVNVTVAGGSATYTYDSDGRRVRQVSGGTTTNYLWDQGSTYGDVVAETDGSDNVQTSYVLGGSELLSQKKGATTSYLLKDGQGNTRALTNSSSGIDQNYRYDAFGTLQNPPTSLNTNYLYTGQQFDALSGLYNLRARYYTPSYGRFLTRDTIDIDVNNPIELNRYSYVANSPTNSVDPSGHNLVENLQFYAFQGAKATLRIFTIASGPAYALLRVLQRMVAGPYAEQAKEASLELKQALIEDYMALDGATFEEAKAAVTDRYGEMSRITVAFTRYVDPVTNRVRDIFAINTEASDRAKEIFQILHPDAVLGDTHAETSLYNYLMTLTNNNVGDAVLRTNGVIGISNGTGPCAATCAPFFEQIDGFAVSFITRGWDGFGKNIRVQ